MFSTSYPHFTSIIQNKVFFISSKERPPLLNAYWPTAPSGEVPEEHPVDAKKSELSPSKASLIGVLLVERTRGTKLLVPLPLMISRKAGSGKDWSPEDSPSQPKFLTGQEWWKSKNAYKKKIETGGKSLWLLHSEAMKKEIKEVFQEAFFHWDSVTWDHPVQVLPTELLLWTRWEYQLVLLQINPDNQLSTLTTNCCLHTHLLN